VLAPEDEDCAVLVSLVNHTASNHIFRGMYLSQKALLHADALGYVIHAIKALVANKV
jgi:hypothetical protein